MLKLHRICICIIAVSCCCVVKTFGFQRIATPAPRFQQRQRQGQRQRHQHYPSSSSSSLSLLQNDRRQHLCIDGNAKSSSCLHLFNLNSNIGGGNIPNNKPNNVKDVVQRLALIVTTVFRQFTSGYMTGYVMAVVWGLLKGPNATNNRAMLWGLDFGVLSAIFTGCDMVTRLLFQQPNQQKQQNQSVSLWNVVIRNMILATYFGRSGGLVSMVRKAAVYGGFTYFFVLKNMKRNAARVAMFPQQNNMNINDIMKNMGGAGAAGAAPVTMEELIQRLSNSSRTTTTTGFTAPTTPRQPPPPSSSSAPSSSKKPSSSPSPADDKKSKLDIVDVEWEKVDNNEEDDDDAKN
jgi:hypothetical protein